MATVGGGESVQVLEPEVPLGWDSLQYLQLGDVPSCPSPGTFLGSVPTAWESLGLASAPPWILNAGLGDTVGTSG